VVESVQDEKCDGLYGVVCCGDVPGWVFSSMRFCRYGFFREESVPIA
jgi:hypothetical protein